MTTNMESVIFPYTAYPNGLRFVISLTTPFKDQKSVENNNTRSNFSLWLLRYTGCHSMQRSGLLALKGEAKTEEVNFSETDRAVIETNSAANNSK